MWFWIGVVCVLFTTVWLLSIPYKDGYHRAYSELTAKGMREGKAKLISSILGVLYIF
ncbi:hypothetical protein [Weissella viridescens]|uniref:hypothetical protein n=1 Tax=Weissella viridescens TaxID=1629 RepID=UPI003AF2F5D1